MDENCKPCAEAVPKPPFLLWTMTHYSCTTTRVCRSRWFWMILLCLVVSTGLLTMGSHKISLKLAKHQCTAVLVKNGVINKETWIQSIAFICQNDKENNLYQKVFSNDYNLGYVIFVRSYSLSQYLMTFSIKMRDNFCPLKS